MSVLILHLETSTKVCSVALSQNGILLAHSDQAADGYIHGEALTLMIEELLRDGYPDGPLDYRFYCFDGKPKLVQVDDHPHSINTFYDLGWKKVDLAYRPTFRPFEIERPSNFGEMCDVAAALSEGFSFVRVDLYNCAGRVVFGELTFTPASGVLRFKPQNWDMALGAMWNYQPRIGQY